MSDDSDFGMAAASTVAYQGAETAVAYGDPTEEWRAIDGGVGLFALGHRRAIVATGGERYEFLQGQLTSNVEDLRDAGKGQPSLLVTAQGRIVAAVTVYNTDDAFEIDVDESHLERAFARLDQFLIADDVELETAPPERKVLLLGPNVSATLERVGISLDVHRDRWSRTAVDSAYGTVVIKERGEWRVPAVEIASSGYMQPLWDALSDAGAVPVGLTALESVRVESGIALCGRDFDESRIATEPRLEWAIHFAKGCYVGQEVIERSVSRGQVKRRLCLIGLDQLVPEGALIEGAGERDCVTTVVDSPALGPVCFAYIPANNAAEGQSLTVTSDGRSVIGRVLAWPRPDVLPGRA